MISKPEKSKPYKKRRVEEIIKNIKQQSDVVFKNGFISPGNKLRELEERIKKLEDKMEDSE